MTAISLPEAWICSRYLRMIHRALHGARAHARHTFKEVVDTLTQAIDLTVPDAHMADDDAIAAYLLKTSQIMVKTRYACNDFFGPDEQPYRLLEPTDAGGPRLVSSGCDAAMSLLDAVENFGDLLLNWGKDFWCRPHTLY